MADAPEKIGRFDYGNGKVIYAEPGMLIIGQTNYIRADLVENLVKALEDARRDMRNAWGAVTSNQVEDKDVAGGLRSAMGRIDAALARIKGDVT